MSLVAKPVDKTAVEELKASVEILCFAIDLLIGKLQTLVWIAIGVLLLSFISPFLLIFQ